MLTLRQIEVIRAVMLSGSISGASRLLNVAQPGLSRTLKHVESQLKVRLFTRQGGRFVPSPEARDVFNQLQEVNRKMEDLNFAIQRLNSGTGAELAIGTVPSIGNVIVPRAIAAVSKRFPDMRVELDILKIEDAIDYLLLGKGEFVLVSQRHDHPGIAFDPLSKGRLVCIAAPEHALAARSSVPVAEIARYGLIGIDPNDPYGRIIVELFDRGGIHYDIKIKARFGTSVCALVKRNLGVAIIDIFTVAEMDPRELAIIPIEEPTEFETFVARREDQSLSSFADAFIDQARIAMAKVVGHGR